MTTIPRAIVQVGIPPGLLRSGHPSALSVYCALQLAGEHDTEGWRAVSMDELSDLTNHERGTITRSIQWLIDNGCLEIRRGKNGVSHAYRLLVPEA